MYKKKILFVVVGQFGEKLTYSKLLAILEAKTFGQIYVFCEFRGTELKNVKYVDNKIINKMNSKKLRKILRMFADPLKLLFYAILFKPTLVNSYQLIPKAWYTVIVSNIVRSKSLISSVGGIPEITSYWTTWNIIEKINLFFLSHADHITTKGKMINTYLIKKGIPKYKLSIFNGAIDTNEFYCSGTTKRVFDIVFIGSLNENKGCHRLIKIVKLLSADFNNLKVAILGKGKFDIYLKELTIELNLQRYIEFYGFVEDTEKYLCNSKLFVLPSKSEGLSTAMLEAMACGCVPIVSDVGNQSEAAIDNFNSFLIKDYNDIYSFAQKSKLLLESPELQTKFRKNGIKIVKNNYSIEAQSKIIQNIFNKIL